MSTLEQNEARQLEAVGECDRLFVEKVSGGARTERVRLAECIAYARAGDEVVVASLDRLARSLVDLRAIVDELVAKGARVSFVKEGLRFAPGDIDAQANLMLSVMGAFAEFERALIRERQAEGIRLAKAAGKYKGRRRKLNDEQVRQAADRIAMGIPKTVVARDLGIDRSTLYRELRNFESNRPMK